MSFHEHLIGFGVYELGGSGIAGVVVIFAIWCLYRIFRREPADRVVRWGVFIERQLARSETVIHEPIEQETETMQWPAPPDV